MTNNQLNKHQATMAMVVKKAKKDWVQPPNKDRSNLFKSKKDL